MKNFKIKSLFFSLMAIAMVTVFLTSCEKDYPKHIDSFVNLEDAPHKKELVTKSKDGIFIFELSSNNEKILNAFDENSISFDFLDNYEIDLLIEKESINNEDTDDSNENAEHELQKDRPFIGISLLKMQTINEDLDKIPPYKIQLDESILKIIKDTKAITVFDFKSNVEINDAIDSRSEKILWENNKRVSILGDCGEDKTKTYNYWSNYGSGAYEWLHSSEFKCKAQITPCCEGSTASYGNNSTWVRRVLVVQDVAPRIYGYSKSCNGETHCRNAIKNTCSGWQPNGCN